MANPDFISCYHTLSTMTLLRWQQLLLILLSLLAICDGGRANGLSGYVSRPGSGYELEVVQPGGAVPTRELVPLNGVWQARRAGGRSWFTVRVPGVYDFQDEVEFRRTFRLDSSFVGKTLELHALGVNNRCTVFLNDEYVGGYEAGQVPSVLELRPASLKYGGLNELRLIVDNRLHPRNSLPLKHRPRLPYNYGGIFRDIFLLAKPAVAIEHATIRTDILEDGETCRIEAELILRNKLFRRSGDRTVELRVELRDLETARKVGEIAPQTLTFNLMAEHITVRLQVRDADFWRPDRPKLYEFRARIIEDGETLDRYRVPVGLSELTVTGAGWRLNGQPLRLRGVDWYEDFAGTGPAASAENLRSVLVQVKQLGANAVRVIGVPPHPYMAHLCDSLGVLLFLEAPLYTVPPQRFRDPNFRQRVLEFYDGLLRRFARHVSVAGWGLGFEPMFEDPATRRFLEKMHKRIREVSSRPTFVALRRMTPRPGTAADFLIVDLFNRPPEEAVPLHSTSGMASGRVMYSVGFPLGDDASASDAGTNAVERRGEQPLLAQRIQAHRLHEAMQTLKLHAEAPGILVHTLTDWRPADPVLIDGSEESPEIHRSGLIARDGERRLAYRFVRAHFQGDRPPSATVEVPGRESPTVYLIAGLGLILLFLFNFNRSRPFRKNLRRVFIHSHGFYTEIREQRKPVGWHTYLVAIVSCGTLAIISSSVLFFLRETLLLDELLNLLVPQSALKRRLVWFIWSPPRFMFGGAGVLLLGMGLLALLLKVSGFFLGHAVRLRQTFTLVAWTGANLVWLLPLVPVYYRILSRSEWMLPALALVLVFLIWSVVRLIRGMRVLYLLSYLKTVATVGVAAVLILGGVAFYYDRTQALFEYVPYYWEAIRQTV